MITVTYILAQFGRSHGTSYPVFAVNEGHLQLILKHDRWDSTAAISDKIVVTIDRWSFKSPNSIVFRGMCEYAAGCPRLADEDAPFKEIFTENARKLFILEEELKREELCLDQEENLYLGASWEALLKD